MHPHLSAFSACLYLLLLSSLCGTFTLQARELSAKPYAPDYEHAKHSQFIVSGLLQQMGLQLPDKKQPQPDKKKTKDDFFDQDFFADDSKSFADITKEMQQSFSSTQQQWQQEYQQTVARWDKARLEFLKQADGFQAATFTFRPAEQQATEDSAKPAEVKAFSLDTMQPGEFYVIPGALEIDVRNQARRSTCAAFAGVRAIEVILNQNEIRKDFSEQHFYWLSKPDCNNPICASTDNNRGSWFVKGLYATQLSKVGLVDEVSCPYVPLVDKDNETQAPLQQCQAKPGVKAKSLVAKLPLDKIINEIVANRPVMSGFTLSDNFLLGKGLVTLADEGKYDNARNSHSGGHAVLLVGLIRLPETMQSEGRFCAITANSWGDGWGRGGYGCLTEKWMQKHNIGHASLQSVELLDNAI